MVMKIVDWDSLCLNMARCIPVEASDGDEIATVKIPGVLHLHGHAGLTIVVKDGEFMSLLTPVRELAGSPG
jgi:hypothetical protein